MAGAIELDHRGPVALVRINRPEARNAIDTDVSSGLGTVLTQLAADDRVRAVVLTGAGDRAFCAGMDLKSPPARDTSPGIEVILRDRYAKPIVAAVNGAAVGGGFDLVLACDLVVAAEHATFGLPEVKRGVASVGGSSRLAQRVPLAIAMELCLTGTAIDAARAAELGLVNRVVPAGTEVAVALALASAIAENAPLAVAFTRSLVNATAGSPDSAQWARLQEGAAHVYNSEDARIGAQAFALRRPPIWTGR
jgi:enoyl-CoA hydratase